MDGSLFLLSLLLLKENRSSVFVALVVVVLVALVVFDASYHYLVFYLLSG